MRYSRVHAYRFTSTFDHSYSEVAKPAGPALRMHARYCVEAVPELEELGIPLLHDSWTADTEEILGCRPDLVLASIPYRLESLGAILESGLPVLALAPHSLKDVYMDTRLIASLVDARPEGEVLIARMQQAVEETRAATTHLAEEERPLVYCEEWGKPMIHSQEWVAELVEAAGGRFLGTPGAHTDAETVAAAGPDVLLFAWCGVGDRVPLAKVVAQRGWEELEVARRRRVHCVPDEFFNTPATTLLDGLHAIAGALHPSIFPAHAHVVTLS